MKTIKKYTFLIIALFLVGCGNYVDLRESYGVVISIGTYNSLPSNVCEYEMGSRQTVFGSFVVDTCGKYQIGDTIYFVVPSLDSTTVSGSI